MEATDETPVTLDVGARDYATPEVSALVAYGGNLALPGLGMLLLVASLSRHRARVAAARAAERRAKEASAEPVAGDVTIHGQMTSVEGEGPAVRVAVQQFGTSRKSGDRWVTDWSEVARDVAVQPFYLTTDAGNSIRIEPPEDVRLLDDLATGPVYQERYRDRVAELTVGEEVYARGQLIHGADPKAGGGYRGGALVLRPASDGRMELSTRPLSEPHADAVASRVRWLLGLAVVLVVVHGLAASYHLAQVFGEDEVAVVTHHEQKHTDDEHYHRVTVALPDGASEVIHVISHDDFDKLAPGARVDVHVTRVLGPRITLEKGPRAHKSVIYFSFIGVLAVLGVCAFGLRRKPRWYERATLQDEQRGRLERRSS